MIWLGLAIGLAAGGAVGVFWMALFKHKND